MAYLKRRGQIERRKEIPLGLRIAIERANKRREEERRKRIESIRKLKEKNLR